MMLSQQNQGKEVGARTRKEGNQSVGAKGGCWCSTTSCSSSCCGRQQVLSVETSIFAVEKVDEEMKESRMKTENISGIQFSTEFCSFGVKQQQSVTTDGIQLPEILAYKKVGQNDPSCQSNIISFIPQQPERYRNIMRAFIVFAVLLIGM
jgi:hypothetical protein